MRTTWMRWTLGTAGAALVLAGCGGAASSTGGTTAPTVRSGGVLLAASQKTVAEKTASISLEESVTGTAAGPVSVSGTGQVDFGSGAAQFALTVPSSGAVTVRLVKPVLYVQLPSGLGTLLPSGKSWVSVDLTSAGGSSALGSGLSQLSGSAGLGTDVLSYLRAASTDGVTTVGPATVRGVATTEYAATIDLTRAAAQKDAAVRAALARLQSAVHVSSVPVHVWIDDQGRVRRVGVDETLTTSGTTATVHVTLEFFDFGAPVEVTAPPADQVVALPGLSGALSKA